MAVIKIYFDGGCIPNPGRGYGSYEVVSEKFKHRVSRVDFGDNLTNNIAEYMAMIAALKWLRHHAETSDSILLFTDSQLLRKQMLGQYRCKVPHLKEQLIEARHLLRHYQEWKIEWRQRLHNVNQFGH